MSFMISKRIAIDLSQTDVAPVLRMKQGDRMTQQIVVDLLLNKAPWTAPEAVTTLQLSYCKSDLVGGCYDKMPDNSDAGSFEDNRTSIAFKLHPQVLTVAGTVVCELRMLSEDGSVLNCFNFYLNVEKSPIAMSSISEGYYNNVFDGATFVPHINDNGILSWTNNKGLKNPAPVNLGIAERSAVLYAAQKLTEEQKAQARSNIGAAAVSNLDTLIAAVNAVLPIARAVHTADDVYTATGATLPLVAPGSSGEHTGKGRPIVFIPDRENSTDAPKLQINGGSTVQIRMRAPWNQGDNSQAPDATIPVPAGTLMTGVPYTMTFCAKYWLIDSYIPDNTVYATESDVNKLIDQINDALSGLVNATVAVSENMEVSGDGTA